MFGFNNDKKLEKWVNICTSPECTKEEKIKAIKEITKLKSKAVPHLITSLTNKDNSGHVRGAAAIALGEIGPSAAVQPLVTVLNDKDDSVHVRRAAAIALGEIGPSAASAVQPLVTLMNDSESELSGAAKKALNKIDPQWWLQNSDMTRRAIPSLVKALLESDNEARRAAAVALEKIDPQQWPQNEIERRQIIHHLVMALVKALLNRSTDIRRTITAILDKVYPQWSQSETAIRHIPVLVKARGDSHFEVKNGAKKLLFQIDPAAEKTIPSIVEARIDSKSDIRRKLAADAFKVLDEFDPEWPHSDPAHRTIPSLIKALVNNDSSIRQIADELLKKIEPLWARGDAARGMVPYFVKVLRLESNKMDVRCAAAETLGKMGPAVGEDVIPHLMQTLKENKAKANRLLFAVEGAWNKIDPSGEWRKQLSPDS
jgi:HEAT repeat protein